MQQKTDELRRIANDLGAFMKKYCGEHPERYDDFVGESCDVAYHMLEDTIRRMDEEAATKKPGGAAKK